MAGRPRELVHGDLCLADLEAGDGEAGRGQGAVPHTQVQHPGTGDMLPTQPLTSAQNRLVRPGSSRSWRLGRPLQTTHRGHNCVPENDQSLSSGGECLPSPQIRGEELDPVVVEGVRGPGHHSALLLEEPALPLPQRRGHVGVGPAGPIRGEHGVRGPITAHLAGPARRRPASRGMLRAAMTWTSR